MNRPRRPKLPLRLCALAVLAVSVVLSAGAAPATSAVVPPGLLLWNKLGSEQEITHSAYGPNLVLSDCAMFGCGLDIPGTLGYPSGVFGGAASITGGPYFSGARVHTAILRDPIMDPERGAVEAWYRQESDPVPYAHNPHRIFGGPYSLTGIDEVNLYSRDAFDSGDPRLHFDLFFGEEPPPFTPAHLVGARSLIDGGDGYPISALNGRWIHIAGVWDRNGIAGSADTIRLYVNGEVVAATQESDWGSTTCDHRLSGVDRCFTDVVGCNDTCADTFAADNLKIWGYAKTDYSDRFQEGSGEQVTYLHGSGSTLTLDNTAPIAPNAKFKDSAGIRFAGGNPWKEIGTWTAAPAGSAQTLSALSDLHSFLGLKNSDDQGTQFDLRAEVLKNGVLVGSPTTLCITGVTRNPDLAKEVTVAFDPVGAVPVAVGDVLSLELSTRIGTNPNGSKCSGPGGSHGSAVGLRAYFDSVNRSARLTATFTP